MRVMEPIEPSDEPPEESLEEAEPMELTEEPMEEVPEEEELTEESELLEREDLTQEDIINFCQGKPIRPLPDDAPQRQCQQEQQVYRQRYKEIQSLLLKLKTGEARVDEDGRLVEVLNPTAPPAIPCH